MSTNPVFLSNQTPVENPPGIFRTTVAYNEHIMMCHFNMKKGAKVPLHSHEASQNGFIVKGRIRFMTENNGSFTVEKGSGYIFGPHEKHGAEVLEEAEVIECFAPKRPEYES